MCVCVHETFIIPSRTLAKNGFLLDIYVYILVCLCAYDCYFIPFGFTSKYRKEEAAAIAAAAAAEKKKTTTIQFIVNQNETQKKRFISKA